MTTYEVVKTAKLCRSSTCDKRELELIAENTWWCPNCGTRVWNVSTYDYKGDNGIEYRQPPHILNEYIKLKKAYASQQG